MKLCGTLFFTSLTILALNCAPANGPLPTQQVIMPLAVGNEWIGRVNRYDSHEKFDSTWLDTLRVLRSEDTGGETWYYANTPVIYGPDTLYAWFTNRPDGLYTRDMEDHGKTYRAAKYPARPGDICATFDSTFDTLGNGLYDGVSVDTTNWLFNAPAGIFNCSVYRGFYYSRNYDEIQSAYEPGRYLAPGVGLIAFGYFQADGSHDSASGGDHTWQLVRAILH
jgi:hypothetical protein